MTDTASIVLLVIMAAWVGFMLGILIGYWLSFEKGYKEGYETANWVLAPMIGRLASYLQIREIAEQGHGDSVDPDSFAYIEARVAMEARGIHI